VAKFNKVKVLKLLMRFDLPIRSPKGSRKEKLLCQKVYTLWTQEQEDINRTDRLTVGVCIRLLGGTAVSMFRLAGRGLFRLGVEHALLPLLLGVEFTPSVSWGGGGWFS